MRLVYRISINIILSGLILLLLFPAPNSGAGDQAEISTINNNTFVLAVNRPPDSSWYKFWDLAYTEIFKRLDVKLKIKYFPMKRASVEADVGRVDGEALRIYSYAAIHPNLVRVEEYLLSEKIVAYVNRSSEIRELKGWDSLLNTSYRVNYIRGSKICGDNLTRVVNKENLYTITNAIQGLRKLSTNRIDVYVASEPSVVSFISDPQNDLYGKIRKAGLMESINLYMYVHKRHKALAPQFAEIINNLKDESLVVRYWKTAFKISEE
ncbi:MAG: amino acid ABC transporter substrate-binding protein [Desulfobulbaceae bacterium]|nr:amino acid ABC transporter substrate-binding protein [Desulfobulbaceae bacterium]